MSSPFVLCNEEVVFVDEEDNAEDDCAELRKKLCEVDEALDEVQSKIRELSAKKKSLKEEKGIIEKTLLTKKRKREEKCEPDWSSSEAFPWCSRVKQLAMDLFGIEELREGQWEIINASLSKYDVFGVMKTGGGKSLCYQLPALLNESWTSDYKKGKIHESDHSAPKLAFTVVISPLISLIRDQVREMNNVMSGTALSLAGSMERSAQYAVYHAMNDLGKSNLKILFLTPEKMSKSKMLMTNLQKAYNENRIERIVIDEVHCASQWGHDFRPDYAKLQIIKTVFPKLPMVLLTATANQCVRDDIINMLRLNEHHTVFQSIDKEGQGTRGLKVFLGDFDRPNLSFRVLKKPTGFDDTIDLVMSLLPETTRQSRSSSLQSSRTGNAIVYCFSQKECESVSRALYDRGVSAAPYHAGLDDEYRQDVQDSWVKGKIRVICATIAFGLGINMPNVRVVVHYTMSKSIELYYQEAGRAGRDGNAAECVLLYAPDDVTRIAGMAVDDVEKIPTLSTEGYLQTVTRPKVLSMITVNRAIVAFYCLYCQGRVCRRKLLASCLEKSETLPRIACIDSLHCSSPKELCDNCTLLLDNAIDHRHCRDNLTPSDLDAPKAEIATVLRSLIECIRAVILKDRSSCNATLGEKQSSMTFKKMSSSPAIKKLLKQINSTGIKYKGSEGFPDISTDDVKYLLASLLESGVLSPYFHFTPYASLCFLQPGYRFSNATSEDSLINSVLGDVFDFCADKPSPPRNGICELSQYHLIPLKCFQAIRDAVERDVCVVKKDDSRQDRSAAGTSITSKNKTDVNCAMVDLT